MGITVATCGAFTSVKFALLSERSEFRAQCSTVSTMKCVSLPFTVPMRNPRSDPAFKIVFGEEGAERRTIGFLNAVLGLKSKNETIKEIQILDPSKVSMEFDRTLFVHVLLQAHCTTFDGQQFVIEMQKESIPQHSNRWIYFCARQLMKAGVFMQRSIKNEAAKRKENNESLQIGSNDFYRRLDPVKVVTILNFDPTADSVHNTEDFVVHWDITERRTHRIASNLLSWTFVILPRFTKELGNADIPERCNFLKREDVLGGWLYFLSRIDCEE
eukprot:3935556-Rhodomonas_salina.1